MLGFDTMNSFLQKFQSNTLNIERLERVFRKFLRKFNTNYCLDSRSFIEDWDFVILSNVKHMRD